ncbi:hypothetical protein PHMEG_0008074 [Phytophthora megakarya]|uniref:Uncharacterized protein n=1 Tax=Phytophthora megakarya TaxID=4795 RepID=A0A225WM29_9STRA|nr:hypothetical protein PHMEG_0008074 [Phytophthora megakarya]
MVCGIDDTSNRLQATGVPPHVAILREIKSLREAALKTIEHVDTVRTTTVRGIIGELEQRAMGAGVVTFDGLDSALQRCLASAGVTDLVETMNSNSQHTSSHEHTDNTLMTPSRVPLDFELPDCSVAMLWVLWQCGNNTKEIPPLRMLDGHDMPNRNLQK